MTTIYCNPLVWATLAHSLLKLQLTGTFCGFQLKHQQAPTFLSFSFTYSRNFRVKGKKSEGFLKVSAANMEELVHWFRRKFTPLQKSNFDLYCEGKFLFDTDFDQLSTSKVHELTFERRSKPFTSFKSLQSIYHYARFLGQSNYALPFVCGKPKFANEELFNQEVEWIVQELKRNVYSFGCEKNDGMVRENIAPFLKSAALLVNAHRTPRTTSITATSTEHTPVAPFTLRAKLTSALAHPIHLEFDTYLEGTQAHGNVDFLLCLGNFLLPVVQRKLTSEPEHAKHQALAVIMVARERIIDAYAKVSPLSVEELTEQLNKIPSYAVYSSGDWWTFIKYSVEKLRDGSLRGCYQISSFDIFVHAKYPTYDASARCAAVLEMFCGILLQQLEHAEQFETAVGVKVLKMEGK